MHKNLRDLVKFMIYKSISENICINSIKDKNKKNPNLKKNRLRFLKINLTTTFFCVTFYF